MLLFLVSWERADGCTFRFSRQNCLFRATDFLLIAPTLSPRAGFNVTCTEFLDGQKERDHDEIRSTSVCVVFLFFFRLLAHLDRLSRRLPPLNQMAKLVLLTDPPHPPPAPGSIPTASHL